MDISSTKGGEKSDVKNNNNKSGKNKEKKKSKEESKIEKSYFDVLGLCCTSEVPLIEKILKPLEGVVEVSVIVPSRTVIVLHDTLLVSQHQIGQPVVFMPGSCQTFKMLLMGGTRPTNRAGPNHAVSSWPACRPCPCRALVKALNQARLEANVRVIGKANFRGKWPSPYVIISGLLLSLSLLKYVYHPLEWLAVAAVAVGIWPIILRGAIALRNFTLDVNILMLIAVVGTLVMKDYTEAGTIVFLFTIAEWLESRASQKATAVMSSILSMTPQQATIADTGEVVNVKDVKLGTILAVKAGEFIPIDGVVVEGTCEADEKTLTGESFPVSKQKDSDVWAGTVNVNGYVSVKTTAMAEDCAVAKMARLVEEAQNNQSSVQRLIDRCAKFYTPAVVLISAGLAVVPIAMRRDDKKHWFHLALVVLVSACPCGLILSTPVATFCALSRAATSGLLIKGGDYLEILAKIKHMAFDKTGTLTRGEFTLTDFRSHSDDISLTTLLYWLSSIESKSSHPIAAVLVDYGRSQGVEPKPENVEDFQNFPGEGVFGKMDGKEIYIGNKKLGQRANCTVDSKINDGDDHTKEARTCGCIYSGGALIGTFSLSDGCRSGAAEAINELKSMGIRTALLTGDSQSTAMHAQEQLGQALDAVHAELLPEDKAKIIAGYKKDGPTAMVGDGVNDAPALATADVGISMGVSGSALATETGQVILMSNDIRKIPKAIKLARKTRRKVIENLIFSVTAKAGVIAFAIAGHPLVWLAVLVDVLTCLIVIFNSMLLLRGSGRTHGSTMCLSHKTKQHRHSRGANHQCCSSKAVSDNCSATNHKAIPDSCGSTRCSSQHHSGSTPCQTTASTMSCGTTASTKSCGPTKSCSSQTHPASTPCQTMSSTKSCGPTKSCSSQTHSAYTPCQTMASTKSCGPTGCSSQSGHSKHCESHECGSEPKPNKLHSPNTCEGNGTCSNQDDHCLDLLESQASPRVVKEEYYNIHDEKTTMVCCESIVKQQDSLLELHEIQSCEPKVVISCCEGNGNNEVMMNCSDSHHRDIYLTHHHHHNVLSHGACHANAVAKHAPCSSLRKREFAGCCKSYRKECCSSGSIVAPVLGGLTEIVTE